MKNGLTLFLGVFATLAISWAVLLLAAHRQLGSLPQFKDPVDEVLHPQPLSGIAEQGRLVYQDLGCATCHTQQVRREDFGGDIKRHWGERPGYARDYLRDKVVLFGQSRLGPDLRNVGARIPEAEYYYKLLYAPESKMGGQPIAHGMPAHKFLFEERPLNGNQPSYKAIKLPSEFAPAGNVEVVPTARAEALVAFLLNLKDTYDYPVERSLNAAATTTGGH
ncbi:MAG: cbb3-type cytochrome c oxidase subunit II [Opitutaceae bacterium]|jgi:cytochrome c oxidase cbb3-type subunit II